MSKRLTLIIVPAEAEQRVRRLHVPRWAVTAGSCCCVLLVGLVSLLAYHQYAAHLDLDELQRLRAVNSEQRHSLQQLTLSLDEMRQDLVYLSETEARVRQLADLDDSSPSLPVAMGGAAEVEMSSGIDEIQQKINQLQLSIDLRRQSQEEIRNLLNDQVSLGRATPAGWPTRGWLTSYFGMRKSPYTGKRKIHEGLDIAASTGTSVISTADGVVARVEYSSGYGKTVIVDHGYGYRTLYGHNSKILVRSGQRVRRGERLAEVGNTGRSTGSHLHYEILLNGVPIDPRKFL